jgi:cell division protein FtsB
MAGNAKNHSFRSDNVTLYRGAVLALVLLCVALVVNEIFGANGIVALRRQQSDFHALQQQIRQLQQQNQELQTQIRELRSDPRAIERQAREQLHMARPGEIILTLPAKDAKPESSPATQPPSSKSRD